MSANTNPHIAADAEFDFKQRLDSEDRAWMHLVAMYAATPSSPPVFEVILL
jgi:hypothetical protein